MGSNSKGAFINQPHHFIGIVSEQLPNSSEDELKRLAARTLDAQHRETVGQIRNYMIGARTALKEGDLQRAGTLAEKAHLLAEDLVTH